MSERNDGGPAFPGPTWQINEAGIPLPDQVGMNLRDYFAAKAMQAMISTANGPCLSGLDGYESHTAKAAYAMADAMLEARDINHG